MKQASESEYISQCEQTRVEEPVLSPDGSGFLEKIGISPAAAAVTIVCNLMVNAVTAAGMGAGVVIRIAVAGALGYYLYHAQVKFGDEPNIARSKAILLGTLTAIPVPLTPFIAIPTGIAGLIPKLRGK